MAPFPPLLIPSRVPHGFTQDPSTDRARLGEAGGGGQVAAARRGGGERADAGGGEGAAASLRRAVRRLQFKETIPHTKQPPALCDTL